MRLHLEFLSGYSICGQVILTDIHVCADNGATVKVFPNPPSNVRPVRIMSERIAEAEEWIATHCS